MGSLRGVLERVERRPRAALVAILAVALAARLTVVVATPGYEPAFDSVDYVRHAESIADGDGFPQSVITAEGGPSAFRPPLYPYLLGGVYAVFGDGGGETAGQVLGAVLGTAAVLLIFAIGARAWSVRIGLVAAALAALAPPLAFLNASLITEPLFLALELGVVFAALESRRAGGDWRWAAAAGVLCGLAALTRSNGILLAIPALIGVWIGRPRFSRAGLAAPVAVLVAAALTVAPWTVRNTVVFDRLVPISTQTGYGIAGGYSDEARHFPGYPASWLQPQESARYAPIFETADDEAELDSRLRASVRDYILDNPGFVISSTARNLLRSLELMATEPKLEAAELDVLGLDAGSAALVRWSFFALAALALAGVVALLARPRGRRGPWFIWLAPVLLFLAAAWVLASSRYRAPVYPFMILLAAIAIADFCDHFARRGGEEVTGP